MAGWKKCAFSLVILFHLMVILLAPNPESVVFRNLEKVILPYANFLGLNTTWRFFSPNPAMQTIFYEAVGYGENGDINFSEEHRFPERGTDAHSVEVMNRLMSATMILTSRSELVNEIVKPYLCHRHPQATEIYLYNQVHSLPSIEKAKVMGGDREDLSTTNRNLMLTIKCDKSEATS